MPSTRFFRVDFFILAPLLRFNRTITRITSGNSWISKDTQIVTVLNDTQITFKEANNFLCVSMVRLSSFPVKDTALASTKNYLPLFNLAYH
jgi:hypothetical protein